MDLGLEGKVAMVAAGTKGIGLAAARALAGEGCRVSVCARKAPTELLGEGIASFACDVSHPEQIELWFRQTEEQMGTVQILVTNTGGPPAGLWEDMTDDQWALGLQSTLMNVVRMSRIAAPKMRGAGWGRIVHVTSLVAKEPSRLLPISSTVRTGLMSLTRIQATELAPFGVTVNCVLPGHTMTDRQIHLAETIAQRDGVTVEQALEAQARSIPIGRLARPEEIAAPLVFLCSERASYVTGVNLLVDGGSVHGPA
ncbi:MAG: SDR family oxidoreductase [Armatimonadetes bacterium]|nr:SDR family oxidoreductase [Armatimonadota bacterium]